MKRYFSYVIAWIALAIVLVVALVSCSPTGTAAPSPSPNPSPGPSPSPSPAQSLPPVVATPPNPGVPRATVYITAQNFAFDKSTFGVHKGTMVTLVFDNKDNAPHNVAIYTDSSATNVIFRGEVFTGPKVVNYEFYLPDNAGNYFFRCDVHPNMKGTFISMQ